MRDIARHSVHVYRPTHAFLSCMSCRHDDGTLPHVPDDAAHAGALRTLCCAAPCYRCAAWGMHRAMPPGIHALALAQACSALEWCSAHATLTGLLAPLFHPTVVPQPPLLLQSCCFSQSLPNPYSCPAGLCSGGRAHRCTGCLPCRRTGIDRSQLLEAQQRACIGQPAYSPTPSGSPSLPVRPTAGAVAAAQRRRSRSLPQR